MAPPAEVVLPAALLREIVDAARAALPNEAVGLIVSDRHLAAGGRPQRYLALRNAAQSPYRYAIDPAQQLGAWLSLERAGEVVWAIVHSHVSSAAVPSATDVALAYFPDSLYLVCSLAGDTPSVRAWSIRDGAALEVRTTVS